MDFFVKNSEDKLEAASAEQVLSMDTILCDAEGNVLNRQPKVDPIERLEGVVGNLVTTVKGEQAVKEKINELEAQIAAYSEAMKKGFPLPMVDGKGEIDPRSWTRYDMARQGKRLIDKMYHPLHVMDPATKDIVAELLTCFVEATFFQNPIARARYMEKYHELQKATAIDIGDTGNVFPVPDILEAEILAFARESSVLLQYARLWDMTSDKKTIPVESGAVATSWGNTTEESNPGVSEVELDAETLSAYSVVNNTTLEDTVSDIVSWLTEAMAEAVGQSLDNAGFNGDGTATYGGCSGILSAACGYSVTMASGKTAFSDLSFDNLSEMISKLDGMRKVGARFFMAGEVLHYVRILKDSNLRPIFIDTVGSPVSGQILGYPYSEVITMPSSSAANKAFIAFGNLRYFALGRRVADMRLSVDPYGLWTTNKTRFKIRNRWALKIGLANGLVRLLTAAS